MQQLSLSQIKRDIALSPRDGTDKETAEAYAECFDQLPPIVVFKVDDEAKYLLVDGWHRYRAAEILGREVVEVETKYGTLEQAKEYALLANLKHGKPLTRKEKQHVIGEFLKLHPKRSNSWIAEDLGCNDKTIKTIRLQLEQASDIPTLDILIGKDDKQYPRSIEQPKQQAAQEPEQTDELGQIAKPEELLPEPEEPPPLLIPMLGPYELNKVHQVDCIIGLMGLPENSLDLVFTDPPYNLGKKYGHGSDDSLPPEEYFNWCMQWFIGIFRALKPGGAFYVMQYPEVAARWKQQLDGLLSFQRWLTWVYPSNIGQSNGNWRRSHRAILYYAKGSKPAYFDGEADPQPFKNPDDSRVKHLGKEGTTPYDWWEYDLVKNVSKEKTSWPNQLPLELVQRIVLTSSPPSGVVCDPFMGSGTSAEAASANGRAWIGFDLESRACKITMERIEK